MWPLSMRGGGMALMAWPLVEELFLRLPLLVNLNYSFVIVPSGEEGNTTDIQAQPIETKNGGQETQNGFKETQNGAQETQNGAQETQNGAQEIQNGTQEKQNGAEKTQNGAQEKQNGAQETNNGSQDRPNEFRGFQDTCTRDDNPTKGKLPFNEEG